MKICYWGSVTNETILNYIIKHSKHKPSIAASNFENKEIEGLKNYCDDIQINVVPSIAHFPKGSHFAWGRKNVKLDCGLTSKWIPIINLPLVKQFSTSLSSFFIALAWLIKNRKDKDKIMLFYFINPAIDKGVLWLCKRFHCPSAITMTDPISKHLDSNIIRRHYAMEQIKLKNCFDGYIFLTDKMSEQYSIDGKPTTIIEGYAQSGDLDKIIEFEKKQKFTFVYTGSLSNAFGIEQILEAFGRLKEDISLNFYGKGVLSHLIEQYAENDNRIQYMGMVDRNVMLKGQKEATCLLCIKETDTDFAKYAFPSKVLEYMSSGTPVLATKIPGISNDYKDYLYWVDSYDVDAIERAMREIIGKSRQELQEMGDRAKVFVKENKNPQIQGEKMYSLLEKTIAMGK